MFNIAQGIIFYLERRSGLVIPEYRLELLNGDRCGFWEEETKTLAIPKWIFQCDPHGNDDPEYCIYYIAHEVAHICVRGEEDDDHGILFYHYFNKLCPPSLLDWELDYLPENEIYLNV